jgi:hypothetical protein
MDKDDFYFLIGTVLALLTFFGIDWKLIRGQVCMEPKRWKEFVLLGVILGSLCFSWIGWFKLREIQNRNPYATFQSRHNAQGAMTVWGGGTLNLRQRHGILAVQIDGEPLLPYKDDYKIIAIAWHNIGALDDNDVSDLNKSDPHDILEGNINISIIVSDKFLGDLVDGMHGTDYAGLLIPNKIRTDQFSTIRQAESVGAIVIGRAGGPP